MLRFGLIPVEDARPYRTSLCRERFIIADPETVVEQIRHFQAEFGMDRLICRLHFPGMPPGVVTEAVPLLGREVIPVFQGDRT